jgi:hypothetical protein
VKARLTTTNRRPSMGQVAFVRAAATMSFGSHPCLISAPFDLPHPKRDAYVLGHEDQVQPGEGGVEA